MAVVAPIRLVQRGRASFRVSCQGGARHVHVQCAAQSPKDPPKAIEDTFGDNGARLDEVRDDDAKRGASAAARPSLQSDARRKSEALFARATGWDTDVDEGKPKFRGRAASAGPSEALTLKALPHRWLVVVAMVASFVLCNMDKVNMSVALIPMAAELGWSTADRGLVSSAFFWGYAATQIPAGYVAVRVGGAKVLLAGVALWSLGTLIAPPLAHTSLLALCASRVLVGLGEGLAPSAVTNIMARLIPAAERSRAVSYVFGGLDLGSVVGLLLCGPLIRAFGWPSVFYVFAVLGLAWAAAWPLCRPEQVDEAMRREAAAEAAGFVRMREKGLLDADADDDGGGTVVPYGKFLRDQAVWALIAAHFCYNWGYYTLLSWLPSYFDLAVGLPVAQSSLLTLIPYLSMVVMTPFVGPAADGLVERGWPLTRVRKLCQTISLVGPAACMLALCVLTPPVGAAAAGEVATGTVAAIVAVMSVAFAFGSWARAGLYCNHQDMSPRYASALLGLSNTAGALPGVVGVALAGVLLERTSDWATAVFLPTAGVQLVGAAIYAKWASSERRVNW